MTLLERMTHVWDIFDRGPVPICSHAIDGEPGVLGICGDHPEGGLRCVDCHTAHLLGDHVGTSPVVCDLHPATAATEDRDLVVETTDLAVFTASGWQGTFIGQVLINPATHQCAECADRAQRP